MLLRLCVLEICSTSSQIYKYSKVSSYKGTRLVVLCDVALGKCYDTCQRDVTLTRPPDDFDSVHGVRSSDDVTSDFEVSSSEYLSLFYAYSLEYFRVVGDSSCFLFSGNFRVNISENTRMVCASLWS